jgi:hypothetical protein
LDQAEEAERKLTRWRERRLLGENKDMDFPSLITKGPLFIFLDQE